MIYRLDIELLHPGGDRTWSLFHSLEDDVSALGGRAIKRLCRDIRKHCNKAIIVDIIVSECGYSWREYVDWRMRNGGMRTRCH